jgi:hypothetical protein
VVRLRQKGRIAFFVSQRMTCSLCFPARGPGARLPMMRVPSRGAMGIGCQSGIRLGAHFGPDVTSYAVCDGVPAPDD